MQNMRHKGPFLRLGASGPEGLEPKYHSIQFKGFHDPFKLKNTYLHECKAVTVECAILHIVILCVSDTLCYFVLWYVILNIKVWVQIIECANLTVIWRTCDVHAICHWHHSMTLFKQFGNVFQFIFDCSIFC